MGSTDSAAPDTARHNRNPGEPDVKPILKTHDAISYAGFVLGATMLGAIVLMYAYEVTSRYLFGAPTTWASDFVSFLLLIMVFTTAPWLTRENGHVAVTIIPDLLLRYRSAILRTTFLAAAVACLVASWICLGENIYLFNRGTSTLTTVRIPKWILTAFITYGLVNTGLYFLRLTFSPLPEETKETANA
ncbi:TRAP transporter small permease [Arenibacterium halophilum]|uniref:TRAP transporter small permease protein n=1 Tax=Arenibacterium halophilum TaxID=2583821 RepID=A0ABY2X238_9RHOB|nr:TRAP transporter small permease [Arenibacterium halophilum]